MLAVFISLAASQAHWPTKKSTLLNWINATISYNMKTLPNTWREKIYRHTTYITVSRPLTKIANNLYFWFDDYNITNYQYLLDHYYISWYYTDLYIASQSFRFLYTCNYDNDIDKDFPKLDIGTIIYPITSGFIPTVEKQIFLIH